MKLESSTKAAIYARLSKDEDCASIDNQVDRCKQYCKAMGLELDADSTYIDDGYTGTSMQRPAFQQMIKDAEAGKFSVLVATGLDRFARSRRFIDLVEDRLLPAEIGFVALDQRIDLSSAAGRFMFRMLLNVFQFYSENTGEKIREANESMRRRGLIRKFGYPYGTKKGPNGGRIKDPNTWPVLEEIFERMADGAYMKRLAEEFTARGIPTARGFKTWHQATIRSIVSSRFYIGEIMHKGSVYLGEDGKPVRVEHDCQIDRGVWERANSRITYSGRPTFKHQFLLDGLLCTSHWTLTKPERRAGQPLPYSRRMSKGKPTYRRLEFESSPYYDAAADDFAATMPTSIPAFPVEEAVLDCLEGLCKGGFLTRARKRANSSCQVLQKRVKEIVATKKKLGQERLKLIGLLRAAGRQELLRTMAEMDRRLGEIEAELHQLDQALVAANTELASAAATDLSEHGDNLNLISELRRLGKRDSLTRLLRLIIDRIDMRRDGGVIYFKPGLKPAAQRVETKYSAATPFNFAPRKSPRAASMGL